MNKSKLQKKKIPTCLGHPNPMLAEPGKKRLKIHTITPISNQ